MKKQAFKRISSAFLAIVTVLVMLPSFALPTSAWSWKDDGKFEVAAYDTPIVSDGTIKVDVELEDAYLSGTKITSYPDEEPYIRGGLTGQYASVADDAKADFVAYVAVDTTGMFIYAEIEDTTIFETTNTNGNDGDCLQLYFDWCTPDIVHPSPEELYEMYLLDGTGWDYRSYRSMYGVSGLQYIGWISADYNGAVSSAWGFGPHTALGPDATDSVIYDAKLIEGGWACEWFIPWRDDEQKEMIANGEQFHCGIGFLAQDDSDIDNLCTPDREENVGIKGDQRKEIWLNYWIDYSMLADLVFVDATCTNSSGHNYETYKTIAPTCVEKGYTVKKCSYCDKTVNEDYVSKLGHDYQIIKSLAPTCEKYGYVITQCSYCFSSINEAIDMIDHDYIMGYCTMCGKAYNTVKVNSTRALVGQEFDVTVSAVVNEGIWSMAFELPIDTNVFEFVSADTSNSIFSQFAVCNFDETTNSYKFNAYNSSSLDNITKGGELVTLTLRVKDNVKEGEYALALELLDKHIINVDQEKVSFHAESGMVEVLDHILGDANGDGDITNADALVIFRYIYNDQLYPLAQPLAADANCDGEVTNADVLMIFRYIYNPTLYPITTECKHTFVNTVVSPTVNNQGYTLHVCNKCGYSYKDNYVPALGNDEELGVYDQIGIPENLNYGGAEVNIASWASPYPEFDVSYENADGDPINKAVYLKNLYTEQLLGVDLVFSEFYTDEGKTGIIQYAESLKNATSDPTVNYDIVASYSRSAAQCFVTGLLKPLNSFDNLDLTKSWWPKNIREEFSMNERLYFITGDISTNMLNYMYGVFYNKGLTDDYGYGSLTDLVNNNEWTLEKLLELTTGVYQNIDNTSGKSKGDLFGITFRYHMMDAVIQGSNFKLAEVTGELDEAVKISEDFTSEKFDSFIADMIEYTTSDDVWNEMPDGSPGGWGDSAGIIFKDGRSFFAINRMKYGFELQSSDIAYGILPMPKYDIYQDDFNTCVDNSYTLYGICTDTQNGDRAATVIQALGYYGKTYTTPAVFDTTFKRDYSKSSEFVDMFDIIRDSVGFDIGRLLTIHMNLIADMPTLKAIANGQQWSIVASAMNLKATERQVKVLNNTILDIIGND